VATSKGHDERLGREIFGQLPADTTPQEAEDRSKVTIEDDRECSGVDER
jgi:hypothetical protein